MIPWQSSGSGLGSMAGKFLKRIENSLMHKTVDGGSLLCVSEDPSFHCSCGWLSGGHVACQHVSMSVTFIGGSALPLCRPGRPGVHSLPPFPAHTPFPAFVFWGLRLKGAAPCLAPRECLDDSLLMLASLLISKQMQPLSAAPPSSWWFQEIQERKESKLFDKMYSLDRIYPSLDN